LDTVNTFAEDISAQNTSLCARSKRRKVLFLNKPPKFLIRTLPPAVQRNNFCPTFLF
jgi:hypothetical protein